MTRPNSDGQFDSQLTTFLAWQAGQVAGAPSSDEMASRVAAGLRADARRRRESVRHVLWVAAVVALLSIALVSAAILAGRPSHLSTPINGDLVVHDTQPWACAVDRVDPTAGDHRTLLPAPPACRGDWETGLVYQLSASSDGRRVAYTVIRACGDCPTTPTPEDLTRGGVWLLDPATGASTEVESCGDVECIMDAAVSPDGRLLAYERYASGPNEVGTLSIVDIGSRRKVTVRSSVGQLRWSPDSSTLAFSEFACDDPPACTRGYTRIGAMSADGSRTWTVFDDPTVIPLLFDWAPEGTLRIGTVDAPEGGSPVTLHEAVADGSGHVVVGTLPIARILPQLGAPEVGGIAWSPDGTRLAWVAYGGQTVADSFVELWVGSADGRDATRLFSGAGLFFTASGPTRSPDGPTWSPDGRLLAFGYRVSWTSAGETDVIGVDGTGLHQIASVEGPLAWLPATPAPTSAP